MTLKYRSLEITKLEHSTIVVKDMLTNSAFAVDPYEVDIEKIKMIGDIHAIFITHDHFDHFSPKDVGLIAKTDTKYVFPASILDKAKTFLSQRSENLLSVLPLEEYTLAVGTEVAKFMALPAYNLNKISPQGNPYHPKEKDYVGFLVEFCGTSIYFAGDTDVIPEMEALNGVVDIAVLPISGTYVMTVDEAVDAVSIIQPQFVIPCHYGSIVGEPEMADDFKQKVEQKFASIQVEIL